MSRWLAAFRQARDERYAACANGAKTSPAVAPARAIGTIGTIGTARQTENRLPDGPDGDDGDAWRSWIETETRRRRHMGDDRAAAKSYAIASAMDAWNRRNPITVSPGVCGGCGKGVGVAKRLALADGIVVHHDADLVCLIDYGRQWRGRAEAAFQAMGINNHFSRCAG